MLGARIAGWPRERMAVIGSSLGGFYATVVAERARLPRRRSSTRRSIRRATSPPTSASRRAWHGDERFVFRAEYIDELRALAPPRR